MANSPFLPSSPFICFRPRAAFRPTIIFGHRSSFRPLSNQMSLLGVDVATLLSLSSPRTDLGAVLLLAVTTTLLLVFSCGCCGGKKKKAPPRGANLMGEGGYESIDHGGHAGIAPMQQQGKQQRAAAAAAGGKLGPPPRKGGKAKQQQHQQSGMKGRGQQQQRGAAPTKGKKPMLQKQSHAPQRSRTDRSYDGIEVPPTEDMDDDSTPPARPPMAVEEPQPSKKPTQPLAEPKRHPPVRRVPVADAASQTDLMAEQIAKMEKQLKKPKVADQSAQTSFKVKNGSGKTGPTWKKKEEPSNRKKKEERRKKDDKKWHVKTDVVQQTQPSDEVAKDEEKRFGDHHEKTKAASASHSHRSNRGETKTAGSGSSSERDEDDNEEEESSENEDNAKRRKHRRRH